MFRLKMFDLTNETNNLVKIRKFFYSILKEILLIQINLKNINCKNMPTLEAWLIIVSLTSNKNRLLIIFYKIQKDCKKFKVAINSKMIKKFRV